MSKSAEGWIRHRGGKAPVSDDVFIDVRYRDGEILKLQKFKKSEAFLWAHHNGCSDIMAYKLHKPAEQVEACSKPELRISLPENYGEIIGGSVEGPLQWRDRITEIDATAKALTTERAELVQKLASEGFALIGRINELLTDAAQKHEDMSDWRKWRYGDLLELVGGHISDADLTSGNQYEFLRVDELDDIVVIDDAGDENGYGVNSGMFKWHSRPSA